MSSLVIVSTLAMVAGIYVAWLVHGRSRLDIAIDPQPVANQPPLDDAPMISVIIPARDEGRNIGSCLQALFRQTYPNYELIVVDDRSSDDTPHILTELEKEDSRLHVVHGAELPSGWAGKPHALVQGVRPARGEWLCFMDADTFAEPALLECAYRMAVQRSADMFSILTEQELGGFWERVILPLVFLGLSFGFPAQRVNDPSKPDAISNGQFILIKRRAYDQVGGHSAVRERIDEDKAIAIHVKRAGFRLLVADGRKLARTRMYTSLPEMWEGWTKNIYLGLLDRLGLLSFGALLGLLVSLALPLWLLGSLVWLGYGGGAPAAILSGEAMVLWGYLLWKRLQACRAFGIPGWYAFTFPLGALLFTAMMFVSAYKVLSGRGVVWKGRRYQ